MANTSYPRRERVRARGSTTNDGTVSSATPVCDNLSDSRHLFSIGKTVAGSVFDEVLDYVLIL